MNSHNSTNSIGAGTSPGNFQPDDDDNVETTFLLLTWTMKGFSQPIEYLDNSDGMLNAFTKSVVLWVAQVILRANLNEIEREELVRKLKEWAEEEDE